MGLINIQSAQDAQCPSHLAGDSGDAHSDTAEFWEALPSSVGTAPGEDPGVALHPSSRLSSLHQHQDHCGGVSDQVVWEMLCFRALKNSVPEMPGSWEAEEFSSRGPCKPPQKEETSKIAPEPDSPLGSVCSLPSHTWQWCHVQPAVGCGWGKNGLWVRMLYVTHWGNIAIYYSAAMLSSEVRHATGQRVVKNM